MRRSRHPEKLRHQQGGVNFVGEQASRCVSSYGVRKWLMPVSIIMEHVDFKDTYAAGSKEIRNCHINIGTGKEISIARPGSSDSQGGGI